MKRTFSLRSLIIASALALTACGPVPPDSAYLNRGGPESLLDVSSEVVTLGTASDHELDELAKWIERDHPTRAELNCAPGDKRCDEAEKILELEGVPIVTGNSVDRSVTLVYERILARDCDQRFKDNRANFYNTNHPAFGCSVAANIVQHVTNKQEFISPNLSDDPSAKRAVTDMHRAYTPREVVKPYAVGDGLVSKSGSGN